MKAKKTESKNGELNQAQRTLAQRLGTLAEFKKVTTSGLSPKDFERAVAAYTKVWTAASDGANPYTVELPVGSAFVIMKVADVCRPNKVHLDKLPIDGSGPHFVLNPHSVYMSTAEVDQCNALIDILANPPKPSNKWHNRRCAIIDRLAAYGKLTSARVHLAEALIGIYRDSNLRPLP